MVWFYLWFSANKQFVQLIWVSNFLSFDFFRWCEPVLWEKWFAYWTGPWVSIKDYATFYFWLRSKNLTTVNVSTLEESINRVISDYLINAVCADIRWRRSRGWFPNSTSIKMSSISWLVWPKRHYNAVICSLRLRRI